MARLVDNGPLIIPPHEVRTMTVWEANDGSVVAIVTDTPEGRSLMNASEDIHAAVQARHPGARVIENYPKDGPPVGPLRESDGTGGGRNIRAADLHAIGIPYP